MPLLYDLLFLLRMEAEESRVKGEWIERQLSDVEDWGLE